MTIFVLFVVYNFKMLHFIVFGVVMILLHKKKFFETYYLIFKYSRQFPYQIFQCSQKWLVFSVVFVLCSF